MEQKLDDLLMNYSNSGRDSKERLDALNNLIGYYLHTDDYEKVEFYLRESWQISNQHPNYSGRQAVYMTQALLQLYTGYLKEAEVNFLEAIHLSKIESDTKTRANAYAGLSEIYSRQFNHEFAKSYIDSTLQLSEKYEYKDITAAALNCKAYLADNLGNKQEALEIFTELSQLYTENDGRELAVIYNNIGELNRKMGNFELAKEFYYKAIILNQKTTSLDDLVMNYSNIGSVMLEQDSLQKGELYYRMAIDLCEKIDNRYFSAKAYHDMAVLLLAEQKYQSASLYIDSSMSICMEQSYLYGIVMNQMKRGEILLAVNELKLARIEFQKALLGADSLGMNEDKLAIYNLLYSVEKKEGNLKFAIEYLNKAFLLDDSLQLEEKNRILVDLQSKYAHEKNEQKIYSLEKSVLEQEYRSRMFVIIFLVVVIVSLLFIAILLVRKRARDFENQKIRGENDLLKRDLSYKTKELSDYAVFLSEQYQQTVDFTKVSNKLFIDASPEFKKRLFSIQKEYANNLPAGTWKEFETRFENVNQEFYDKLLQQFPDLTPTELRLCSFLKLKLTTREIAGLLNRSIGTVDNARSNLRKKMKMETDNTLADFLLTI